MVKSILLYLMSLFYLLAGINHFVHPVMYLYIIPSWLPHPETINYIAGACEIIFALLLLPVATCRTAAILIIALLIAVFPANVQMMLNYYHTNNPQLWFAILRLPFQPLLILWAWLYVKKQPDRFLSRLQRKA